MAIKKSAKKKGEEQVKEKEVYFYGIGRRKESVARVRLYPSEKVTESGLIVNGVAFKKYFPMISTQNTFISPLRSSGLLGKFRISVLARGGGVNGQSEASKLGIARALVKYDEKLKKSLKDQGFLKRDSRVVERKKPGLKKARKAPQWAKR